MKRVFALVMVSLALVAIAQPANAVERRWYKYKYTTCGEFKRGAKGFVSTAGHAYISSKRMYFDNARSTATTYDCVSRDRVGVRRLQTKLAITAHGTGFTMCTWGLSPGCTRTAQMAKFSSDWHTASGKTANRVTDAVIRGDGDEAWIDGWGRWTTSSSTYSTFAGAHIVD